MNVNNLKVGETVQITSSQCIGIIIRSWTAPAVVTRVNTHSIRVQRAGARRSESFKFTKVLSTGQSLYRGGVHEIIKF